MTHKELVDEAMAAIDAVFSDTSVSRGKTKASLEKLAENIDSALSTMTDDESDEEDDPT